MKHIPNVIKKMDFLPRRAEANLQAEFFHQCRERHIPCFLEYSSRWNESKGTRFDAVIHDNGRIWALCEIKKSPDADKRRRTWWLGRQGKNYLSWDVPVFLILSENDFQEVWDFWGEVVCKKPTED